MAKGLALGLDTSDHACSVCLYDMEAMLPLHTISQSVERGHGEIISDQIQTTFETVGLEVGDLGAIFSTVGPGSFTGIRVSMALATGMASMLDGHLVGVSNYRAALQPALCAMQSAAESNGLLSLDHPIIDVIFDARRCEFGWQRFSGADPVGSPQCLALDVLIATLKRQPGVALSGCGAPIVADAWGKDSPPVLHHKRLAPIAMVCEIATRCLQDQWKQIANQDARLTLGFAPAYFRSPDAKKPAPVG